MREITTIVGPGDYHTQVKRAADEVRHRAALAEQANFYSLSAWYESVGRWVRQREQDGENFTLTLPDPMHGGDPLTVIEVFVAPYSPVPARVAA